MHTNRLIEEKSPYLLQHAHNPVDWRAWGPEAFAAAEREDKPIFLSIGYSTCHWCHVMERESFESEEIAEVLNRSFIPIKVDREERPDVDRIYMMFVQATTGGGGWPMSVWLTPDLKPFYGGTYFPPGNRYGRPGFRTVLDHIAEAWKTDRAKIVESGNDVLRQMRKQAEMEPERMRTADETALETCFLMCRRTFDARLGGFGNAPKFPRPAIYNFLLRYYYKTRNQEALDMVLKTLHEMARGGMNDQLGGGFHRYSVDARWFVPHFEKMLYDQAQLAVSYVEAFQITQEAFYSGIARDVLDYVIRDMTSPEGGFYSAEDADSVIDPADPHEKGEGAFYIWTQQEIDSVLGQPAAEWFSYAYGVQPNGNVEEDPHQEFTGRNILFESHTAEQAMAHFGITADELLLSLNESRQKLLAARAHRVRPHLDDKILTAWNGLMISAFAKAAQVLDEPRYAAAAEQATRFLLAKMLLPDGTLLRRYREGDAAVPGFLDDYAFFIQALLDVYETTFDGQLLGTAIRLAEKMTALFEDRENGAFFSTAQEDESLLLRMKDDYDGAEPSGNSIAALVLVRLAQIAGREDFRASAEKTLKVFYSRLMTAPVAVPQVVVALAAARGKGKQVILVGERQEEETRELLKALNARFLPERILLLVDTPEARSALAGFIPVIGGMERIDGKPTAYVCEDYSCKLPVNSVESFSELLQ